MVRLTFFLLIVLGATDVCCAQKLNFDPPPLLLRHLGRVHQKTGSRVASKIKHAFVNTRRARRLYNVAHKEKWLIPVIKLMKMI